MNPNRKQNIDPTETNFKRLIILSLFTKFVLIIATIFIFKSFIDTFAITYYFEKVIGIFQGQIPYISYGFEYPILAFIPILISVIPAMILNNGFMYVLAFMILMVCCDCVTLYCIYKIALKIWGNHRQAFMAGTLYATAFSVAYVTLTEYAAFATMLMMLGILYTVDNTSDIKGYIASTLGVFTKVFPVITLPFIVLYNAKETSIKT